ncbi:MAG: hypothetical protein E7613_08170 [Ruminococcaceae bacterium]|nr:hypothetical protein [Oscillospiraceae bacterium]
MKELSTEHLIDPFKDFMWSESPVHFDTAEIDGLSLNALSPFANEDGSFTKSFSVELKGSDITDEFFIVSSVAQYESEKGDFPAAQVRIVDGEGKTIYYSPVYEIGYLNQLYRREWRIAPIIGHYTTVKLDFIIPESVRLHIQSIKLKHNYGYRERDIGIRYHGHGGFVNALGMQLTAEAGFTSCITVPKFTKDGVGVCVHDDTVRTELTLNDGRRIEEGSLLDKNVWDFTYDELMQFCASWRSRSNIFADIRVPTMEEYFRICSMTGMQPVFSVHPELTEEQWIYVRDLLVKYRLFEHFWVKSSSPSVHKICNRVFGNEIAGRILIQGAAQDWDPAQRVKELEIDTEKQTTVIEFFAHAATEKKIVTAKEQGYLVSIAAMKGGISGPHMTSLIDLGVTEFTLDHHMSMGLAW